MCCVTILFRECFLLLYYFVNVVFSHIFPMRNFDLFTQLYSGSLKALNDNNYEHTNENQHQESRHRK